MNYRHAYHAGGFADVVKHAVLTRILVHLVAKPAAFRVIDTHAGAGRYDLAGPEASRTNEWRRGIARVLDAPLAPAIRALLAPYLDCGRRLQSARSASQLPRLAGACAQLSAAAGSPDRLRSLSPRPLPALVNALRGDPRLKALAIDGWTALSAYVPPKERRGLVLVDPPFEAPDDFARLALGLAAAHRKWPTGIYQLWYPIKDRQRTRCAGPPRCGRRQIPKLLRAELNVAHPRVRSAESDTSDLSGSGELLRGHRQSALDARARACGRCCRRSPDVLGRGSRHGADRLARARKARSVTERLFSATHDWSTFSTGLALTFRLHKGGRRSD